MSTPSQPDDQATHAGAAASWPNAPQHDQQPSAPQHAAPHSVQQGNSPTAASPQWPGHPAPSQPAHDQQPQVTSAPQGQGHAVPQAPGGSAGSQHQYAQQQYGAPTSPQHSASAPCQDQHNPTAQPSPTLSPQYGSAPQQYGSAPQYGSTPQQYGSAPQQNGSAPQQNGSAQQQQQYGSAQQPQYGSAPQQYGSAQQQYGATDTSGVAPATAADPVKKRATLGIILGASTVVLGLVLYILQTVLLRVLIQNGNYETYPVVTAAISWLSVLAMGALGVIAFILGLSAAKSGQHQVRSGIAIGVGALAAAGAVITLIEFLLNFALAGY